MTSAAPVLPALFIPKLYCAGGRMATAMSDFPTLFISDLCSAGGRMTWTSLSS